MSNKPITRASDFAPEVLQLFDQYVHGLIDRRAFLEGAARYSGAGLTALGVLTALSPNFAQAQKVSPTDARLESKVVQINSPLGHGTLRGLLVRPKTAPLAEPLPLVLVAHENRGLNPHIEDIARRLALENFIALAPDALTPLGGYPGNEDAARTLFAKLDQGKVIEDFIAAARYLESVDGGNGQLGVVGFCWGGGMANILATRLPMLRAAVPFYGPAPALESVPQIRAQLLLHFADQDERINAGWPAYEQVLKAADVRYSVHHYAHTQHGFHNDTTPRYDEAAAQLAWQRTLAFLNQSLRDTSNSARAS